MRRWLRWLGYVFLLAGLVMIPWMVWLGVSLPATATARHWPQAWIGLDVLEALGFLATGALAVRGDRRLALPAAGTAALLAADAWFDVNTAGPGADFTSALILALGAEIPLSVGLAFLAWRVAGAQFGKS